MTNNEAGAFLNITPDVLKKLDSFDEKLEKIEKHAHTAADALKNGFGSVVVDTSKLENAITSLASKISALNTAGKVFDNIGDSAQQSSVRVEGMSSSISSMAQTLNQLKFSNFSIETFSPENVAKMRESVSQIKSQLKNNTSLSDSDKSALSKEKAMYEEKLKEYQSFINIKNKIAANANAEELRQQQTTYRKMTNVMESYMKKVEEQKQRYESAMKSMADYAAQSPAQRTSAINNTLSFSANAKTLQDDVAAIKLLKEARLQLDKTDKNYQATLNQINSAIAKHNQALTEAGVKSQQLTTRHRNLMDTAGQLSRQLALLFSVSQIEGYISKLAKVRGEFELQQRSLQAILQNKSQADQIFNKTVQLAVKSPFQIKELVTFTKQLAAYRIESDKLYDTTKRLADVSAGLGVDMGRLILAYGQVKAAAYLRGTEVRQFTEAGINMYGELQKLFKTRDQADYTTAQIVDMISKRKVTFEDVKQVFENLTSKEGIFYNMQEIQAETLQGKISNLKDSIDVMLNSIGKANEDTLKGSIDSIKVLIDNWETVAEVAKTFGVVVGSLLLVPKIKAITKEVSLLSFALTKAETSLRSLGLAFKSSLPLMALGVALQLVNELWNVHSQYNKMLRESSNKYYTAQLRVGEIDEIAKNNTRDALSSLVKEMNNEGFEIQIKPNISEKEAKEQFEEYRKQYTDFLEDIRKIEANYAENRKKGWLIGDDDIETDLDEYENSFNDFIAKGNKIQAELLRLSEESTSLGKGAKEYIQELVKGKKEGEDLIDYYKRLADYLEKLQNGVLFAGKKSSIASSFLGTRKDWEKDKEKAVKEIREIFDSVNDEVIKGNKTREQFKILINKGEFSKEWSDIKKQLAYDIYNLGDIKVPLRPGVNKEEPESDSKHKRDILAERISLIKELNKEYEKLSKVMGSDKAAKTVMERYADSLKNVNMPKNIIGDAFLPNKQNTAKALQEISKIITDFRKKQGAINDSYQLLDSDDVENIKKQLDKTKKNIEAMFNGLDLHKKLKDAGLSEAEVQQLFPGLAKTLDDVQRSIDIEFQTKYADTYKDPNTQQYKDYQDAIKEIDQQRIKEQQDTAERLIKSYKAQLSEQLQLDEQYYKDLEEIRDKFQNTPDLQKRLEENATKMYNQKSANNAWKEFTSSDSYLNLFDNIEYYSTAALQSMKDKLVKMREELKDLSPTELKQIMEQEKKLDKQLNQRDPWNKLIKSLKEYTKLRKENAKNEKDEAKARDLQAKYEKQLRTQSKIVAEKKAAYESATENIDAALEEYEVEKNNYDLLVDKKKEQDKIIAGYDAANRALSQQAQKLQGIIQSLGKIDLGGGMVESISGITNSVSDFAHMLEDSFGVAIGEDLYEILDGVGALFGSLESFDITKPISSSLNVLTGLGKTIGSIFGIGNKNKKKEREIQRQIKNIESLGRAYDELKEKMEAAWSADDLRTQTKDTIANLDQQIESYENMINSEEAKKDSDRDRIDEWNDAINELKKTRQEILDQQKLELGGIGGESEYKDAASSFVQAWMDAFNETEDGLKALNENFDSFIENLIVKQATMRLAQGRLKELFEKIDESVTEGSVGGINLTKEELANIQALGESALKGLNEDLLALMETLGYKGTSVGQKSELSALTQSIQGVSETTAEALEALLNSIRFFVNQQTTDIAAIRVLLEARYSLESQSGESNPMIVELRAQTRYLEILSDRIDRVFAPSPNSKGPALRVVMQ